MSLVWSLMLLNIWHFEPIPDASNDVVLDVDTSGMARVAYYKDSLICYATRNSMGDSFVWINEILDSNAVPIAGYGNSAEMAVDKKGIPHVVYFKRGSTWWEHLLYYATRDSTAAWNAAILDTATYKVSIDGDSLDRPHVIYCRGAVWHQYWNGSAWTREYAINVIGYITQDIDRQDRIHISIGPPLIGGRHRSYQYGSRDTAGWHVENVLGYDVRWPLGIAADTSCRPHLSFHCYENESFHTVKEDSAWNAEEITEYGFFNTCIAVIGLEPHLLGTDSGYVRYLWKPDSSLWLFEEIHAGYPKALVADKDGYLHCIIIDSLDVIYGTNRPQSGICDQSRGGSTFSIGTISRVPVIIRLNKENAIYRLIIFDVSGRLVKSFNHLTDNRIVWNGCDNSGNRLPGGVYFIKLDTKSDAVVKKVILVK